MTETVVGRLSDFPEGTHKVVEVGGRRDRRLQHRRPLLRPAQRLPAPDGPLCEARRTTGTLVADASTDWRPRWAYEGEVIACPWHGLEFHVPTGRCFADPRLSLRAFEVAMRGDDVIVRF